MWEKFKQRLGKFVQDVKAIFRRRGNSANAQEKEVKWDSMSLSSDFPANTSPTEERYVTLADDMEQLIEKCIEHSNLILDASGQVDSKWIDIIDEKAFALLEDIMEELKFSVNRSRTNLPKRIPTKALIVSIAANQPYEYVAADLSQLEERGIAHLIHGIAEPRQEKWEKEGAQEAEVVREYLEEYGDNELVSSVIPGATLLYWEDLDIWDWE